MRRGRNNVTPIKDQGGCGSCVAFGTTSTLESMILIEHNVSFDLSEAELLFCGGGSCGGWWPDSAVTCLLNKGIAHETCFPYQDHNMPCTTCAQRNGEAIRVRNHVTTFDVDQRKRYLAHVGPVMAVFEVHDDFFAYSSGVYHHVAPEASRACTVYP
jgi:C1A family cysteine protease